MRRSRIAALALLFAPILHLTPVVQAQVDGVVLIDQNRALAGDVTSGDLPDFPVTISQQGSFRLSGNLHVDDPNITAIEITVDNVTLDLNGFTIQGPADRCLARLVPVWCLTTADGVGVLAHKVGTSGLRSNIAVLDGTVRAMRLHGVFLGAAARVENVVAMDNRGRGIYATRGALITNNISRRNRGTGIFCYSCLVIGNTVMSNGGDGIRGHDVVYGNNLVGGNKFGGTGDTQIVITGGAVQAGGNLCFGGPCQ